MKDWEGVYDPAGTAVARIEFYGATPEDGAQYMHRARAQLGSLLAYNGVPDRIAAGESGGFFSSNRSYDDGVRIQAITNDGQHTLRIWTPKSPPPVPQRKGEHEETVTGVSIVGACVDAGPDFQYAVLWDGFDSAKDLGFLPQGYWAEALDISDDGSTIVGYCDVQDDFLGTIRHAFRWTGAEGMVDLGALTTGGRKMVATGVSKDGLTICGWGDGVGVSYAAWIWRKELGLVQLPDEGLGVPPVMPGYRMSPSGQYVVGLIDTVLVNNNNTEGALWTVNLTTGAATVQRIPAPGTSSILPTSAQNDTTMTIGDYSYPRDVTDTGLVMGFSTHVPDALFLPGHQDLTDPTGLNDHTDYTVATTPPERPNTTFTYDPFVTGAYVLSGDGQGEKIADADLTLVGNGLAAQQAYVVIQDIYVPESGTGPPPVLMHSVIYQTIYTNNNTSGWYMAPGKGEVTLGDHTWAADISEDGEVIVGRIGMDTVGQSANRPYAWVRGTADYQLPLLPGTVSGRANAVASNYEEVTYTVPDA